MLSTKEKALVGLGAAIAAGCQICTRSLIRAAREAGACERGIRLAIETGLAARTSATEAMALWAEAEQGQVPVVDAAFRLEKERPAALISAGATYAANSTATLDNALERAQDKDWTDGQIAEAFAIGSAVAKTAATKVEVAASRRGFSLAEMDAPCCSDQRTPEVKPPQAPGICECAKG